MKNTFVLLFAALLMIGITACEKSSDVVDSSNTQELQMPVENYESSDLNVYSDIVEGSFQEGTMEQEMNYLMHPRDNVRKRDHHRKGHRLHFRRIFQKMQIDRDQMMKIHRYFLEYRKCLWEVHISTMEQRREILRKGNAARKVIIESYRNGEIERREAMAKLRNLNHRIKNALRELVDKEAICKCFHQLLRNIYSVLDEDQQQMFLRWLKSQKHPCLPWNPGNNDR